jgi:Glycosyltransferase family 87
VKKIFDNLKIDKYNNRIVTKYDYSTVLVTFLFASYILWFLLLYIRFTYFAGTNVMRFPQDIMTMIPAGNDLYACVVKSTNIIRTKSIIGVPNVYTPFSVIIFNIFSRFDFETIRIGSFIVTGLTILIILLYLPRYFIVNLKTTKVSILLASISIMSYGLRFELERGQINELVLCLSLLAIILSQKENYFFIFISFIIMTFTFQMKVWPLAFIPCLYNRKMSFKCNFIHYFLYGIINAGLFLSLGIGFFKHYLDILKQSAQSPINIWVANMSLYSYNIQLSKIYNISHNILVVMTCIIVLIFFISLCRVILTFNTNRMILSIYLSTFAGLLFPNISYDYKLSVYYVMTILFYISYNPIYINREILCSITHSNRFEIEINKLVLIEYIFLILPLVVYPMTLFSYVYKYDLGFFITSNTTPLLVTLVSIISLIWLQIRNDRTMSIN